jgi:hypothetical protein
VGKADPFKSVDPEGVQRLRGHRVGLRLSLKPQEKPVIAWFRRQGGMGEKATKETQWLDCRYLFVATSLLLLVCLQRGPQRLQS